MHTRRRSVMRSLLLPSTALSTVRAAKILFALLVAMNCYIPARAPPRCSPCKKTCLLGYEEDKSNAPCQGTCECRKDPLGYMDDMKLDPNVKNFLIKNLGTDDDLVPATTGGAFADAGRADVVMRWGYRALETKWKIPYVIGNVSSVVRSLINEAIADYETYICMDFVERTTEESYLHFMDDDGGSCWSYVGRRLGGINYINLDSSRCSVKGIVIHEILHSMGFFHEHQRPDRDDYITVYWSAIEPAALSNFVKLSYDTVDRSISTSIPYDIGSVMQYYDDAFSQFGAKTLTDIHGNGLNVQREGFAKSDILQLQLMYQCTLSNSTSASISSNTSYSQKLPITSTGFNMSTTVPTTVYNTMTSISFTHSVSMNMVIVSAFVIHLYLKTM